MSLSSFPLELLHFICQFLSTRDIINLRLVSRTFAAVGSTNLLPELTFTFLPRSIERLRDVSIHPLLRRHVKTLICTPNILPVYTYEEYRQEARNPEFVLDWPLDDLFDAGQIRRRLSESDLAKGWTNYQELLKNADSGMEKLGTILSNFINIQCFRLQFYSVSPSAILMFRSLLQATLIEPRPMYNSTSLLQILCLVNETMIPSFYVDALDPKDWIPLRNVREIKLEIVPPDDSWTETRQYLEEALLLPSSLEVFAIHCPIHPYERSLATIGTFWTGVVWPLHTVSLSGIDTDPLLFSKFLTAHSIKSLSISNCNLLSGIWSKGLLDLPATKVTLSDCLFRLQEPAPSWPYVSMRDTVANTTFTIKEALEVILSRISEENAADVQIKEAIVKDLVDNPPNRIGCHRDLSIPVTNLAHLRQWVKG